MGLEKAIASGKEHRKEYRGAKRVSRSCRNNGGGHKHSECPYCQSNREHNSRVKEEKANFDLSENIAI